MRIFVTAFMLAVVLASSAFAGNVALSSGNGGIATATSCPSIPGCNVTGYSAGLAIDGNSGATDKWIAPGNTVGADLLINLGALFTVDYVTIEGIGSYNTDEHIGKSITFSVFVGGVGSTEASLLASTPIGSATEVGLAGGAEWSTTFNITPSKVEYVLYDVTASCGNPVSNSCTTYDNAYANDILVDAVPEPGTIGLIGAGLLALGFSLRSRKK